MGYNRPMYLTQFLTIVVVHLLAVMSPGPDFVVVAKNSLTYSRKIAIYTALGLACGISLHVLYSLLGIGLIISQSIILFNIIKYLGAAYLLYIGYKSLRSKSNTTEVEAIKAVNDISVGKAIRTGFLTNALNPKATLFFLAVFTQVVDPSTPFIIQGLYGVEMMVMTFVWFSIVAILFTSKVLRNKIQKVQHRIEQVTGVVLIALGIKVALAGRE